MYKNLWRNKNFILLALGGFISSIGDYFYSIAITVSLYSMTKSIGAIAVMWLSRGIFRIPVQYFSGIITDYFNKKTIIIVTNALSVIIAYCFVFVNSSNLWLCFILAFLLQSINDIDVSAENAILPEVVEEKDLKYANSIFSVIQSVGIFLSPALAGIVYKYYGDKILFIVNAISFFIATIVFLFIKYQWKFKNRDKTSFSSVELFKSGIEGYKILKEYLDVRILFIIMTSYAILGRFFETYKVVVADSLLNINADGIIYFQYAMGIGGLLVPLLIKKLSNYKKISIYILSSICMSICFVIFGFSHNFIVTFITLIVLGSMSSIQGIFTNTIIQESIPKEYMGRVFSANKIILTFFAIIGLVIATPLYNLLGVGSSFLIIGIVSIVVILCSTMKLKDIH